MSILPSLLLIMVPLGFAVMIVCLSHREPQA